MYTSDQYLAHFQSVRELHVRIDVLNSQDVVVDRIETDAIDGSIDIDGQSPVRRTCDLRLLLTSKLLPSPSSPIWLNKRFRVWIGIRSLRTGEIQWFNMGIFVMSDPDIAMQIAEKSISLRGLDKMCLLNGDIAGQLRNRLQIPVGTPIHSAIRSVAELAGETKLIIETHPYSTPYTIEVEAGSTYWDVIEELTSLYMNWQAHYDVNGFFCFNQTRVKATDAIIWNWSDKDFRVNSSNHPKFSNVKNHFIVYGRVLDNGTQPKYEHELTNSNSTSPFTIEKIGRRLWVISEDSYFTQEQCLQRVNYEMFLKTNLAEEINISALPVYFFDSNKLVEFNSPEDNIIGKYALNHISFPLKFDGTMSFSAFKVY